MVSLPQRIGLWTVTSLVPSGKVASTWISWIISAMPSITCSRRITVPPSRISSATERPSRAPSTTKSLISATASGWLSLTPRSSRRRATLAAIATSNLSFSRGVRFMGAPLHFTIEPASNMPNARHAAAAKIAEEARHRHSHRGCLAQQPRDQDAIYQGDARPHLGCAFEQRACLLEARLGRVPHADHRGERIGGAEARACRRLAFDPQGVGPDPLAGPADGPGVEQEAAGEALARGAAAQHHHLAGEQRAARRHLRHGPALQASTFEHDGFLRQPVERRGLADRDR